MKKFLLGAAVLFVSFTSASAQFTFTSIDYPGGTQTRSEASTIVVKSLEATASCRRVMLC